MIAARQVSELPFVLLCLLGALSLVACSTRDPQREKNKADRQAVVGVWSSDTANGSFGIVGYHLDGSFWSSNTYGSGLSARSLTTTGTWDTVNGQLIITNRDVAFWNWGTRQRPSFPSVDSARIVWVTDQELAIAVDDEGANIHVTNILHREIKSKPTQSSAVLEKAKKINLSNVKFDGLPLALVIPMLQDDGARCDPAWKGIPISLGTDAEQFANAEVNLELKNTTLAETLERVADSVGLKIQATDTELLLVKRKTK